MTEPVFVPREGQIDFTHVREVPCINCIVVYEDKMLIVKRAAGLRFHPGLWFGVSGMLDEPAKTVEEKVREELREELGITEESIISIEVRDAVPENDPRYDKVWLVHPVLVTLSANSITLDWEAEAYAWITPRDIVNYETVPDFPAIVRQFFPFE